MPRPFRELCNALNGTLTPAFVGAGYVAPNEPFNRQQDRYEFKRALPSGHRHTIAVLFNRRRTPEFTIQLFIEPPEGMAALVAHGGSLIVGMLSSARPIWPIGVRRFGTKRSPMSRLLRRRAPTAADAIQRALAMLPEVETWWHDQRDTRHIITGTVRYRGTAGTGA